MSVWIWSFFCRGFARKGGGYQWEGLNKEEREKWKAQWVQLEKELVNLKVAKSEKQSTGQKPQSKKRKQEEVAQESQPKKNAAREGKESVKVLVWEGRHKEDTDEAHRAEHRPWNTMDQVA